MPEKLWKQSKVTPYPETASKKFGLFKQRIKISRTHLPLN
jgi:hypothetical protein